MGGFKRKLYCIVCECSVVQEYAVVEAQKLCICRRCYEHMDKYTSPVVLKGDGYIRNIVTAYPYSGCLREAFIRYKFKGEEGFRTIFEKLLIHKCGDFINWGAFDLLIPVPLSRERLVERGFNQAALPVKGLAEAYGLEYSENALFRVKNTKRQSALGAEQRYKNVRGAFLADRSAVAGKRILLADDIYTMGFTLRECARTLIEAGCSEVRGMCLMNTPLKK